MLDAVPVVRTFVTGWAQRVGAPQETVERLGLTVSEAVSNVVFHAYRQSQEPGEVRLTLERPEPYLLYVTVADSGLGMVPRLDSPGLGMGLPLIAHFAHGVEIRAREPHGVELQICFDLREPVGDRTAA